MDHWTPKDRDDFVARAVESKDMKGTCGPYYFNVYPQAVINEQEDKRKTVLTETIAKTIYSGRPEYRKISLKFYEILMHKLSTHFATGPFMYNNLCVLLKGGNAYTYLVNPEDLENFPYSDLDVVIYINPLLEDEVFEYISYNARIIVLQTISQYKRMLDHMFFINKPIDNQFLCQEEIDQFKADFNEAIRAIPCEPNQVIMSPFESDEVRNSCSRYSFMLTHSKAQEDKVVRVELPHFDKCERIPMRKTPLFCSYNETISFKRDDAELDGHFDLYRIRWNCLFVERNDSGEGPLVKDHKITADFIDVAIASKDDAELIDFWKNGKFMSILDKNVMIWLNVPTIDTCVEDLYKMLHVYRCPEGKRAKRQLKYDILKRIAGSV